MPDPKRAPRIVVYESDACAGVISGWSCDDCDDDDCEHECHHAEPAPEGRPQDVPEEWVRLARTAWDESHTLDMQVRCIIAAVLPEHVRRVREQVAAEIEAECIDPEWPNDDVSRNGALAAAIARGESR